MWRRAGYPHLILPGARADNGTEYLVALPGATLLRSTVSQPKPALVTEHAQSSYSSQPRDAHHFCRVLPLWREGRGCNPPWIGTETWTKHGDKSKQWTLSNGPSEAVLLSYIKMPSDATNPVAVADLLAQTHQVPIHRSPARPLTIQGNHHPISLPSPGRTRTNAPGAWLLAT